LAVDARNLSMRFGTTLALRNVSVQAEAGKIHALIGANGAGKSTFLGIIAGRIAPTHGSVAIFGRPYSFGSPRQAHRLGIAAIYQELTIVPAMSTQANVFLGQVISRAGLLDKQEMRDEYRRLCARLGVAIPADIPAKIVSIQPDNQAVKLELREVRPGKELEVKVTPANTSGPENVTLLIRTDYPPENPATHYAYVRVK